MGSAKARTGTDQVWLDLDVEEHALDRQDGAYREGALVDWTHGIRDGQRTTDGSDADAPRNLPGLRKADAGEERAKGDHAVLVAHWQA